jgi:cytochrome P450
MVLMYQASASFLGRIEEVMAKRREKGIQYNDFLGHVMEDDASVGQLSDCDKCAAACGPLIAATSSTSLSLTMVLKYLHDYPQVRESIKVRNSNSCFKKVILAKYSSMNFTY